MLTVQAMQSWAQRFRPMSPKVKFREQVISATGAFLGLLLAALISHWSLGELNPWFIAPMGATAVLLFAVPASPLAQPWSLIGGNLISALVGVTVEHYIHQSYLALSIAVAVAIFAMLATRCLHPPSGAVAMTAVLGGPSVVALGYHFVIWPVLINSLLLLLLALIFNNLVGRHYPHHVAANHIQAVKNPLPSDRVGVTSQDFDDAIQSHTELLDISTEDLKALMLQAQRQAFRRISGNMRCEEIMSKNVLVLSSDDSLTHALQLFEQNNLMSLPVLNEDHRLVGSLSVYHLMQLHDGYVQIRNHLEGKANKVYQVMDRRVFTARPEQPIGDLIPAFVDKGFHYLPVINKDKQILGIISRSDMLSALFALATTPNKSHYY